MVALASLAASRRVPLPGAVPSAVDLGAGGWCPKRNERPSLSLTVGAAGCLQPLVFSIQASAVFPWQG